MLSGIRTDEVRSLVRWLSENENRTVNVKAMLFETTTNVMMRMIAGKRYYGENMAEAEETVKFREMIADTLRLGDTTNIGDYLPILRWVGVKGKEKGLRELQRKRDRFMQSLIEEHRTRMAKEKESSSSFFNGDDGDKKQRKKTMIEVMLSLQEKEPDYYTDQIIRGLMLVTFSFTFIYFCILHYLCSNLFLQRLYHGLFPMQISPFYYSWPQVLNLTN